MSLTHNRRRVAIRIAAIAAPLLLLAAADATLSLLGLVAPLDPLVLHARSFERGFSPLVARADGSLIIREDWVSDGASRPQSQGGKHAGQFVLEPGFRSARILRKKPAGTIRIFALGGSSTFGMHVGKDHAFPARLEERLRPLLPGCAIEVVNLGCPGWASDRVANLAATLLELEPDLIVIYSGHNELLDGHPATGPRMTPLWRARARLLSSSSLFGWLDHLARRTLGPESTALDERAVAAAAGKALVYDPLLVPVSERRTPPEALRAAAAVAYASNLTRLITSAKQAGVPVLLALPVANLLVPPTISADEPTSPGYRQATAAARRAFAASDAVAAKLALTAALAEAPRSAILHFWRGRALARTGRTEEARAELQSACDLDIRMHRITSSLTQAFRKTALATGTPWIDVRDEALGELTEDAARHWFVDHVHPTAYGHDRIAARLAPLAAELLTARKRPCGGL